jgi:ferritin-like metal-binding protein YciE
VILETIKPFQKPSIQRMKTKTMTTKVKEKKQNDKEMDVELHELFLEELGDILNAEQQLTKALPKMAHAANCDKLKEAFKSHLVETENHIKRLEQVFECLDEPVKTKKCKAMKGLLEEGKDLMEELKHSTALDAALICAAQKVEHYEIASYGTVCAWAKKMGHDEALELLGATLKEEFTADKKLTKIAEKSVN